MTATKIISRIITAHTKSWAHVEIGGKAKQLFALRDMGLRVPYWAVVPHGYCSMCISHNRLPELVEEVLSCFANQSLFAVRSSANLEDGKDHSFAGQFSSLLFVTKENLAEAIREVYNSVNTDQVKTYCQHHNIDQGKVKMSVIIQEMISAEAAGVAFGINPLTGNPNEKVVNATWGVGEGLVSGALNADEFILSKNEIQKSIAKKENAFVLDQNREGITVALVSKEKQSIPCLEDKHLEVIVKGLDTAAAKSGKAQDIEFALYQDKIYFLQTRPVTTAILAPQNKSQRLVWDNSNIVESYPGLTSPLTFSFIRKMYESVYITTSQLMGVSKSTIQENAEVYKNMLGLIKGRVYYNLKGWYKALSLLPGYSLNAAYMEKMMGVKESFELSPEELPKGKNYFGVFISMCKLIFTFLTLGVARRKFMSFVDKVLHKADQEKYETYDAPQLLAAYNNIESTLLNEWKAPLFNDFFAMIFYGLLEKLSTKWLSHLRPGFCNELLARSDDIISVQPIRYMDAVYQAIQSEDGASIYFMSHSADEVLTHLQAGHFPKTNLAVHSYIKKFGDRAMGELKLETITYRQEPATFITYVQNGLRNGYTPNLDRNHKDIKAEAENTLGGNLGGVKLLVYRMVLKQARILISGRENLRFERTRAFGQVRKIFNPLGSLWASQGIIAEAADIFYISIEEISDYIKGMAIQSDLQQVVKTRKATYDAYESSEKPADRIETFGAVYHQNDFYPRKEVAAHEGNFWQGKGASAGIVRAKVKLVTDPKEVGSMNGYILVATCTDPSWVTLFPSAAGILVERGSMLSHSAIVAREMGIPCIVALDNLMLQLPDGADVEMNGSTGMLVLLDE